MIGGFVVYIVYASWSWSDFENDHSSTVIQTVYWLVFTAYPILLFLVSGYLQWAEDNFEIMCNFVKRSFAAAAVLILGFYIAVIVLVSWKLGVALLLGSICLALFVVVVYKWKQKLHTLHIICLLVL